MPEHSNLQQHRSENPRFRIKYLKSLWLQPLYGHALACLCLRPLDWRLFRIEPRLIEAFSVKSALAAECFEYGCITFKDHSLLSLYCFVCASPYDFRFSLFCTSWGRTGGYQSIADVTNLQAGRSTSRSSIPYMVQGTFLFSKTSIPFISPTQPHIQHVSGAISQGINQPGLETN
jgi:hypothetical protein